MDQVRTRPKAGGGRLGRGHRRTDRGDRRRHRRRTARSHHRRRQRATVRAVRTHPSIAAGGHTILGGTADPPSARLRRTALHLCRPGSHCAGSADGVDQLSGPDARGSCRGRARRRLAKLVSLFPVGGSPRSGFLRTDGGHRRTAARLGGDSPGRADAARATPTCRHHVRPRRAGLERGTRPAALRTAVGGRAGAGVAAGEGSGRSATR